MYAVLSIVFYILDCFLEPALTAECTVDIVKVNIKVKFALEQVTKA